MTKNHFPIAIIAALALLTVLGCSQTNPLLEPDQDRLYATAPDSFRVAFETTQGPFTIKAYRDWSPAAVDRFHYLVKHGFYDDTRFFRVVPNFVAQFGLSGDPAVNAVWENRGIPDEPVQENNAVGTVAFARSGPESRTTQLFISLRDNSRLDALEWNGVTGFPPFGRVVEGMDVVAALHNGYGEQPNQDSIRVSGNAYLDRTFPDLDRIVEARILKK